MEAAPVTPETALIGIGLLRHARRAFPASSHSAYSDLIHAIEQIPDEEVPSVLAAVTIMAAALTEESDLAEAVLSQMTYRAASPEWEEEAGAEEEPPEGRP